jgi:hypothetical protein
MQPIQISDPVYPCLWDRAPNTKPICPRTIPATFPCGDYDFRSGHAMHGAGGSIRNGRCQSRAFLVGWTILEFEVPAQSPQNSNCDRLFRRGRSHHRSAADLTRYAIVNQIPEREAHAFVLATFAPNRELVRFVQVSDRVAIR